MKAGRRISFIALRKTSNATGTRAPVITMNRLSTSKRTQILRCLVDGMSLRATGRVVGANVNTVMRLLTDVGPIAWEIFDKQMRGLTPRCVQADEMWCFVAAKDKTVHKERAEWIGSVPPRSVNRGSVWLWVALDPDSKLVISWHLGHHNELNAHVFMRDLASRVRSRIQLTTDAWSVYRNVVEEAFDNKIDYGLLVKHYGTTKTDKRRQFVRATKSTELGLPDPALTSTSLVERQNLTVRMCQRRYTRRTNGFSKKFYNLWCATALHYFFYNFVRPHQSLGVAPALAARLVDTEWELRDLVILLEQKEALASDC